MHVVVTQRLHLLLVLVERRAELVHLVRVRVRVRVQVRIRARVKVRIRVRVRIRCAVLVHPLEEQPVLGGELGGVLLLCAVVLRGDGVALSLLGQLEVERLVRGSGRVVVGIRERVGMGLGLGLVRVTVGVRVGVRVGVPAAGLAPRFSAAPLRGARAAQSGSPPYACAPPAPR